MIKIGIAGIGFMGWIHYLAYQRVAGAKIAAICEQNKKRLTGDWRDIQGNFGPRGEVVDVSRMNRYDNLDELVADPNVDVVDICLPPSAHADAAVKALQHGKHVFCEKPMSLDHRRLPADGAGGGQGQASDPDWPRPADVSRIRACAQADRQRQVRKAARRALQTCDLRSAVAEGLLRSRRLVGGPLLDLHIHDAHLIRFLFGMPKSLISQGRMRGEVVEYCNTMFEFDDPRTGGQCHVGSDQSARALVYARLRNPPGEGHAVVRVRRDRRRRQDLDAADRLWTAAAR